MTVTIYPAFNPAGAVYSTNGPEAIYVDEFSGSLTYVGWAGVGSNSGSSVWKIQRITVSGSLTSASWADGNPQYDNVWENRAILNYS